MDFYYTVICTHFLELSGHMPQPLPLNCAKLQPKDAVTKVVAVLTFSSRGSVKLAIKLVAFFLATCSNSSLNVHRGT